MMTKLNAGVLTTLNAVLLLFGTISAAQDCAVTDNVSNAFEGNGVVAVVRVDSVGKQQSENSFVKVHTIDVLRDHSRFFPHKSPWNSVSAVSFLLPYKQFRRPATRSAVIGPPRSAWDGIKPKAGQFLLIVYRLEKDYPDPLAIQSVHYPDDPAIALIKSTVQLRGANDRELIRRLDDECAVVRFQAATGLQARSSCAMGTTCRDEMLSQQLAVLSDRTAQVSGKAGWNRRAVALEVLHRYVYDNFGSGSSFNERVLRGVLPYLQDEDEDVRGNAAGFIASTLQNPSTRRATRKVLAGSGPISLEKLRSDLKNCHSPHRPSERIVLDEFSKLGVN